MLMEIQLINQEEEKGILINQAKLRIITKRQIHRKLWELLGLLEAEGTVTCNFKVKDGPSGWHSAVLRKSRQGYVV